MTPGIPNGHLFGEERVSCEKHGFFALCGCTRRGKYERKKVESIKSWKAPASVKAIQIFIEFANFYRRFIKNFSAICTPITNLLKGEPKKSFLGKRTTRSLWGPETSIHLGFYPMSLLSRFEHSGRNRCYWLCTWLHIITVPWQKASSSGFPLSPTLTGRTQLRHSR